MMLNSVFDLEFTALFVRRCNKPVNRSLLRHRSHCNAMVSLQPQKSHCDATISLQP